VKCAIQSASRETEYSIQKIVLAVRLKVSILWLSDKIISVCNVLYLGVRKGRIDEQTLRNPAALSLSCAKISISLAITSHLQALPLPFGTRSFIMQPTSMLASYDNFCGATFKMSKLITHASTSQFHTQPFRRVLKPCYA